MKTLIHTGAYNTKKKKNYFSNIIWATDSSIGSSSL